MTRTNGSGSCKPTPIAVLQARAKALQDELGSTVDEVAEVTRKRDADLHDKRLAVDAAEKEVQRRQNLQAAALRLADQHEETAHELIAQAEARLRRARQDRALAEKMDLGEKHVGRARRDLREAAGRWKDELAQVQSSDARRKRAQLEQTLVKLERRLARKLAEPPTATGPVPVLPVGRGTPPSPTDTPAAATEREEGADA